MKRIFLIALVVFAVIGVIFFLIFQKGKPEIAVADEFSHPIVDILKNAKNYYSLHPRIEQAFEFLNSIDMDTLSPGKYEIDGNNIFITVSMSPLRDKHEALLEAHNEYIDIHVALGGDTETFGWSPRHQTVDTIGIFDTVKDIQFFRDIPQVYFPLHQGMFSIFMPEDAHATQIGNGEVKKAVIKMKYDM